VAERTAEAHRLDAGIDDLFARHVELVPAMQRTRREEDVDAFLLGGLQRARAPLRSRLRKPAEIPLRAHRHRGRRAHAPYAVSAGGSSRSRATARRRA